MHFFLYLCRGFCAHMLECARCAHVKELKWSLRDVKELKIFKRR